ncbi:MAG: right-handed parallel beta-helix repeat-containing protein [Xanthobacteraceae bacterium]
MFAKIEASAMTRMVFLFALLVTTFVCLLPAVPARAQAARTFVSAAGSDSNNCINVATPCRHFAAAYAATAADGEIDVLDPANYGALIISQGISIQGHGWASLSAVGGGASITINAGGKINISGVILDGGGAANSTGIQFNGSGGTLSVRDSVIRNFGGDGIAFQPNSSGLSQLFVSNTLVSDSGNNGINISPSGSGTTACVLDHVELENNGTVGVSASSTTQSINVTVSDSVSANNGGAGISTPNPTLGQGIVAAVGRPQVNIPVVSVMVRNSTIANNNTGVLTQLGTISITRSTIIDNFNTSFGAVSSYQDNNIVGNSNDAAPPVVPIGYK